MLRPMPATAADAVDRAQDERRIAFIAAVDAYVYDVVFVLTPVSRLLFHQQSISEADPSNPDPEPQRRATAEGGGAKYMGTWLCPLWLGD